MGEAVSGNRVGLIILIEIGCENFNEENKLSQSEKIASQYDRYMDDDYSKIVEQVRAERQAVGEAVLPKEVKQGRNIGVGYCGR